MSTLEDKLEQDTSLGGRAEAPLAHLIKRWGSPSDIDVKRPPELVFVKSMADTEVWRRIGPMDGGKTRFELIERRRAA